MAAHENAAENSVLECACEYALERRLPQVEVHKCRYRAGLFVEALERYALVGELTRPRRDIVSDVIWAVEVEPEVRAGLRLRSGGEAGDVTRKSMTELTAARLAKLSTDERAEFDETCATARLALEFGEKVRDAREAAGLSQRGLASRMSTSQAAVARLEAGGVGSTLTTLQKVADALGMSISVDLTPGG